MDFADRYVHATNTNPSNRMVYNILSGGFSMFGFGNDPMMMFLLLTMMRPQGQCCGNDMMPLLLMMTMMQGGCGGQPQGNYAMGA